MRKRDQHFATVQEFKERFAKLPTEKLVRRLRDNPLRQQPDFALDFRLADRSVWVVSW